MKQKLQTPNRFEEIWGFLVGAQYAPWHGQYTLLNPIKNLLSILQRYIEAQKLAVSENES